MAQQPKDPTTTGPRSVVARLAAEKDADELFTNALGPLAAKATGWEIRAGVMLAAVDPEGLAALVEDALCLRSDGWDDPRRKLAVARFVIDTGEDGSTAPGPDREPYVHELFAQAAACIEGHLRRPDDQHDYANADVDRALVGLLLSFASSTRKSWEEFQTRVDGLVPTGVPAYDPFSPDQACDAHLDLAVRVTDLESILARLPEKAEPRPRKSVEYVPEGGRPNEIEPVIDLTANQAADLVLCLQEVRSGFPGDISRAIRQAENLAAYGSGRNYLQVEAEQPAHEEATPPTEDVGD